MPTGHGHATGLFDAGHCQACACEAGPLGHHDRAPREEARLRYARAWTWTARRWAGRALVADGAAAMPALVALLTG